MNDTQLQETARRMVDGEISSMEVTMITVALRAAGAETKMGLSSENVLKLAIAVWRMQNPNA